MVARSCNRERRGTLRCPMPGSGRSTAESAIPEVLPDPACCGNVVMFQRKLTRCLSPIIWSPFALHLSVGVTSRSTGDEVVVADVGAGPG